MITIATTKYDLHATASGSRILMFDDRYLCQSYPSGGIIIITLTDLVDFSQRAFSIEKTGWIISSGPIYHDGYIYQPIRSSSTPRPVNLVKLDISDGTYVEFVISTSSHSNLDHNTDPFKHNGLLYFSVRTINTNATIYRYNTQDDEVSSVASGTGIYGGWSMVIDDYVQFPTTSFDLTNESIVATPSYNFGPQEHNIPGSVVLGNKFFSKRTNNTIEVYDLETKSMVDSMFVASFGPTSRFCIGPDNLLYLSNGVCVDPISKTQRPFNIENRAGDIVTMLNIAGDILVLQSGR